MVQETVLYTKEGAVAQLVLNRPHVINAYNMEMRDRLYELLEAVRDDPDVRAIVLRGAGERGFCAGADLTEFGTAPSQEVARRVRWERDVWGLFIALPKPLVAALHGWVIGSGVEMACLCDVRIASQDAVFSMPETSLGMIPAAGGTQTIPRSVCPGRALELMLTGRRLSAQEALRWGLVDRVVPRDRLVPTALETAAAMTQHRPDAVAALKRALWEGCDLGLEAALELEARLARALVRARGLRQG